MQKVQMISYVIFLQKLIQLVQTDNVYMLKYAYIKLLRIMPEECLATLVTSSVMLTTINLMMVTTNTLVVVICVVVMCNIFDMFAM